MYAIRIDVSKLKEKNIKKLHKNVLKNVKILKQVKNCIFISISSFDSIRFEIESGKEFSKLNMALMEFNKNEKPKVVLKSNTINSDEYKVILRLIYY